MSERRDRRAAAMARRTRHNQQLSEIPAPSREIIITVPVTLCAIVAHLVVFLRPGPFRKWLPDSTCVCDFFRHGGVVRNVLSCTMATFLHARVSHLVYDITLLLWSGLYLERSMGSLRYAITLPILEIFSQWLRFIVNSQLRTFSSHLNISKCVVGCSATLFALKVIVEKQRSHLVSMPGLPTPFGMSTWVGLFAIYASVPETSTTGHVCGILAGYTYVLLDSRLGAFQSATVFIHELLSNAKVALEDLSIYITNRWFEYQNAQFQREDTNIVGRGYASDDILVWACQKCGRENGVFISNCDYCDTPRSPIGQQYVPSAPLLQENDR